MRGLAGRCTETSKAARHDSVPVLLNMSTNNPTLPLSQGENMKLKTDVDHYRATYRAAMASIPDPSVRARVEAILSDASKVVWLAGETGEVQREQAARKLLVIARQSPAICDALVRIVEHCPRKSKWFGLYWLCFRVVGDLIIEEKLSPDHLTLVVRSIVDNWFRAIEWEFTEASEIADQINDDLNWAILWLRRERPALLLAECYRRLCDDPESYSGIHSLLDGWNEKEDAIMATWL
jgi:hypothetical protein